MPLPPPPSLPQRPGWLLPQRIPTEPAALRAHPGSVPERPSLTARGVISLPDSSSPTAGPATGMVPRVTSPLTPVTSFAFGAQKLSKPIAHDFGASGMLSSPPPPPSDAPPSPPATPATEAPAIPSSQRIFHLSGTSTVDTPRTPPSASHQVTHKGIARSTSMPQGTDAHSASISPAKRPRHDVVDGLEDVQEEVRIPPQTGTTTPDSASPTQNSFGGAGSTPIRAPTSHELPKIIARRYSDNRADLEIICGDGQALMVHMYTLAGHCTWVDNILSEQDLSDPPMIRLELLILCSTVVHLLDYLAALSLLGAATLDLRPGDAEDMYVLADHFGCSGVKDQASTLLRTHSTTLKMLQLACRHGHNAEFIHAGLAKLHIGRTFGERDMLLRMDGLMKLPQVYLAQIVGRTWAGGHLDTSWMGQEMAIEGFIEAVKTADAVSEIKTEQE